MNKLKRSLAMLLVLCMLLSVVPFSVFADTTEPAETTEEAQVAQAQYDEPGNSEFGHSQGKNKDKHKEDALSETDPVETTVPETTVPETTVPETTVPETTVPETTVPETTVPETTVPETTVPETTVPETTVPETTVPETTVPETTVPETTVPETTVPETADLMENPYGLMTLELEESEPVAYDLTYADNYRILHLDCGRKYFTKDWIIALINEMDAAGYTHLELAFGNDGLRFLLDDMSVDSCTDEEVTAAIKAGNKAYYDAGNVNELTQSEMDAIIAHAKSVGIGIIPLLNTPGHMDAIITAMKELGFDSPQYSNSARTVDVADTTAVAFVQKLVYKYMDYFAARGCNEFNIGSDEYANDTGSPQFSALVSYGYYDEFITYLNALADYACTKGMIPMTFNDGIYYNQNTSNGTINENIMVCYWSSGWSGYDVASASYLANKGFKMINTHGDYYFVLTSSGITNPSESVKNFSNTTFMGSDVSDPAGSMFCIWCDAPGTATEQEVAAAVRITLRKMAAAMQDTTSYSEEVVSGGFNADGSIVETREWVTIPPTADGGIQVSGYDLTSIEVTEVSADEMPAVEGATNVVAWDITPYASETKYTEKGIVNLPVPEGWNTSLLTGFYVENGTAVLVKGTYADGYYAFEMPHFSVGGLAELAEDAPDKTIELTVAGLHTEKIEGVDLNGQTYTPTPEGIATVTVEVKSATTGTTVSTAKATTLEDGATYILRVYETLFALSANTGRGDWGTHTLAFERNELVADKEHLWTLEASGSGYKLKNAKGYLNLGTGNNAAYLNETGEVFTITYTDTGWTIGNQSGRYINALGGLTSYYSAGGWTGDGTRFDLYKVTTATSASTTLTFNGVAPGEAMVTINDTVYKIIVHGNVEITIKYQTADGTVIKTETVTVVDNATTYSLSNFTHDSKYYTMADTTLNITPATVTEYTVIVTEAEENLNDVTPLKLEYWITNGRIQDSATGLDYVEVSATKEGVNTVNGVAVADLVPATGAKDGRTQEYWLSKLLDVTKTNSSSSGTEEQTIRAGDDETLVGATFTHIRYWNTKWQVLVGTTWTDVNRKEVTVNTYDNQNLTGTTTREANQLVVYYMEVVNITNSDGTAELHINGADWGTKGDNSSSWGYPPENTRCSVSIQLIYENGDTNPSGVTADALDSKTIVYYLGENGRGLGTMIFTGAGDYQIFKVTAETGDMESEVQFNNGIQVTKFTWDDNEEVVWQNLANPQDSVSIGNPAQNPSYEEPYDNLAWHFTQHNKNNAILIRVYVKAKVTEAEDTLYVHYIDRTANNLEFYTSEIPGYESTVFAEGFALDSATEEPNDLVNNTVQTSYGQTYTVNADLKTMTQVAEYYRYCDYTCVEVKRSDDGKDVYLYYTFTPVVSFVVDFGTPITITPNQLVQYANNNYNEELSYNNITEVGVIGTYDTQMGETATAEYGTVAVSGNEVVYTPTEIMQGVDFFTIYVESDSGSRAYRVYIVPATTVYYEESILTYDSNWTVGKAPTKMQLTEVLGFSTHYGYDDAYKADAKGSNNTVAQSQANGATASFTFTGTGFELYANSLSGDNASGIVTVYSQGQKSKLYMIDTALTSGDSTATDQQANASVHYSLPIISEKTLPYGTYTVQLKQTNGEKNIYIDGVRIINTINDTTKGENNIYYADKEDNPEFHQLRDAVLNAIGVEQVTGSEYGTPAAMAGQVYNAANGATAIILDEKISYGSNNAQDLLDNGPKNELYLYPGQTLAFKFTTNRVAQLGLKSPTGNAKFRISGTELKMESLSSTVDMFYKIAEKGAASGEGMTVTIAVTDGVLSVTDLKICDDPGAAFLPLTQNDIENVLHSIYDLGSGDSGETETPEAPTDPVEPEQPEEPTEPEKPSKPEKPGKPANKKETASLNIRLVDYRGKAIGSVTLKTKGEVGKTAEFSAEEIRKAADKKLPKGYELVDSGKIENTSVGFGESETITIRADKVATLKITYVSLRGKKVGSATITRVQTANGYCRISASDIQDQAPSGRQAIWFLPATIPYGSTTVLVIPVI